MEFKNKAFIGFITAGDPDLETTAKLIEAMQTAQADLIEIGIPFSDPVAEGPVIEAASVRALANGTTTDKIFDMLEHIKPQVTIPLAIMTYINPVFTYGATKFIKRCSDAGIACIIVPDLPYEEKHEILPICNQYDIKLISLIAPTSEARLEKIAQQAEGFLYCVSSKGVTGMRETITTNIGELIQKVKQIKDIPCMVGFGISTPAQAKQMAAISDGVIVGSAIVDIISVHGTKSPEHVAAYVKDMKDAILEV